MLKARTAWLGLWIAVAGIFDAQMQAHAQTQAQRLRQLQQQTEQQQRDLDLQQRELEQQRRQIEQQQQEIEQRRGEFERLQNEFEVLRKRQAQPPPPPPPPSAPERPAAGPALEALNTRLLILAAALVSLGLFQLIALGIQAFYVWLAMRAMQRTAALAERNLTLTQRAFVFARSLNATVSGDSVTVVPVWENNGATPARSLRISTNWRSLHGELPSDFPYNYQRPPERVFLGPKASCDVGAMTIPLRDVQAAMERRLQLYVWGRATYEDIFEGTDPHFAEFCYQVVPTAGPSGAIKLAFAHHGPYNRADGDSMRPNDPDLR